VVVPAQPPEPSLVAVGSPAPARLASAAGAGVRGRAARTRKITRGARAGPPHLRSLRSASTLTCSPRPN
jgi:hypothetical protein